VSCDVNYRSLLWSREAAAETLTPLIRGIELVSGGPEDACMLLGPDAEGASPEDLGKALVDRFAVRVSSISLRASETSQGGAMCALLTTRCGQWRSRTMDYVVADRLGGGDALTAGLIFGLLEGREEQQAMDFAVAAAVLKHSIPGDMNLATVAEVERLLAGDTGGRPRR
jgi:2-dehydro-3-deoxygluconokinase